MMFLIIETITQLFLSFHKKIQIGHRIAATVKTVGAGCKNCAAHKAHAAADQDKNGRS